VQPQVKKPATSKTRAAMHADDQAAKRHRISRAASVSSLDTTSASYAWEKTPRMVLLAAGFNKSLYPALGVCTQEADKNSELILEHLAGLLDCIPQMSVPEGPHSKYYNDLFRINHEGSCG
jgi:hypothetical protein